MRGADYNLAAKLPHVCEKFGLKIVYVNEEEIHLNLSVGKGFVSRTNS